MRLRPGTGNPPRKGKQTSGNKVSHPTQPSRNRGSVEPHSLTIAYVPRHRQNTNHVGCATFQGARSGQPPRFGAHSLTGPERNGWFSTQPQARPQGKVTTCHTTTREKNRLIQFRSPRPCDSHQARAVDPRCHVSRAAQPGTPRPTWRWVFFFSRQ